MKKVSVSFMATVIIVCAGLFSLNHPKGVFVKSVLPEKGEAKHDRYQKPDGSYYSAEELLSTWNKVQQMSSDREERSLNSWSFVGPDYINTSRSDIQYTGRVRSLELVTPIDNNDNGLRVGSASGGIWKMHPLLVTAYGESMQGNLPTLAIGSTATNPLNSRVMLAGTGEPYGVYRGMGIFKTYDAGQTWSPVTWDNTNLPNSVMKILYNPADTNVVYAATDRGLYRSLDGGNSWFNQYFYLNGIISDLAYDLQHPDTIYAAKMNDRLYKTTNGGSTWLPLFNGPAGFGIASIAVSQSSPNIIFMVCDSADERSMGIYKSSDFGITWSQCPYTNSQNQANFDFHWNQGHYNNCISIKPTDPNVVLAGGGSMLRTTNGWNFTEGAPGYVYSDGHHDNHAMVWRPDGGAVYLGNDGGLFYSTDDGKTFTGTMNILPITQFYDFDIHPGNYNITGATQDNANPYYNGSNWNYTCGGDGWSSAFNYLNTTDVMTRFNASIGWSTNEGVSFSYIDTPHVAGGLNAQVKFERSAIVAWPDVNVPFMSKGADLCYHDLVGNWATLNSTGQFPADIFDYSISYRATTADRNNIYISLSPKSTSKVWKRDRSNGNFVDISHGLPSDTVNWYKVFAAPYHYDEAYAVKAWGADIYKTTDAGATNWMQIPTTALPPGVIINTLFVNPYNSNEIYIGTLGYGVFKTVTNGFQWLRWENGMPYGMDISAFHMIDSFTTTGNIYLYASSYGRGIWKRELSGNDPSAVKNIAPPEGYGLDLVTLTNGLSAVPVHYHTGTAVQLSIRFFDLAGNRVAQLFDRKTQAGEYTETLQASALPSGTYICAMFADGIVVASKKMVLIK